MGLRQAMRGMGGNMQQQQQQQRWMEMYMGEGMRGLGYERECTFRRQHWVIGKRDHCTALWALQHPIRTPQPDI